MLMRSIDRRPVNEEQSEQSPAPTSANITANKVVASDLTPEKPRLMAWSSGGSSQALPFADGDFDVVTSSFGAIFAPDHRAVADEMLRVCRPGGTVGMLNFTPVSPLLSARVTRRSGRQARSRITHERAQTCSRIPIASLPASGRT
jgi:ubiquinone/menaquinone biosynthesis C-methylase UbiE